MSKAADVWLRRFRTTSQPRTRLVCLPHAGGTASMFTAWPALLPDDVEVLAVAYPGRQQRLSEPCVRAMPEMVEGIVSALDPLLDRPIALFGHSMGAAIAFEMALALEATGSGPTVLFLSGRPAPHHVKPSEVYRGNDDALIAEVCRLEDTNTAIFSDPGLRELFLPALRCDYQLIETYRAAPGAIVSAPIVAYAGNDDPACPIPGARAWAELTTGQFAIRTFPGGHFGPVKDHRELVTDLRDRLSRVPDRIGNL